MTLEPGGGPDRRGARAEAGANPNGPNRAEAGLVISLLKLLLVLLLLLLLLLPLPLLLPLLLLLLVLLLVLLHGFWAALNPIP